MKINLQRNNIGNKISVIIVANAAPINSYFGIKITFKNKLVIAIRI